MSKNYSSLLKYFFGFETIVFSSYFYSFSFFLNLQISFVTSFMIIIGSSYSYKKMIDQKVKNGDFREPKDVVEMIEDPHELYDDFINEDVENLDASKIKEIISEEKSKIKTFSIQSLGYGSKGSFSLFRIVPYILFIFGFIGLANNNVLELYVYLPGILLGIIIGSVTSKQIFMK